MRRCTDSASADHITVPCAQQGSVPHRLAGPSAAAPRASCGRPHTAAETASTCFIPPNHSQIVGLQACHYLVLCLITPPLLVLFANPLALELEGGPANVAMVMDWREMTGRAVLDDRIGEYTRLPSSLGRDPSGGVARIPGFGGSAGGTSPSSGDRVSIGDDGLVHPGPEAFRAYEASEASEAAAAAAASSRRPHRRRQLAASPSEPRLAKQDKREARHEEENHRAVALPDSPLALMHEAQQQDRSEQNSASSAREEEGESGKGQAQQSSADPKRGWTIGLSWMLASSIECVSFHYRWSLLHADISSLARCPPASSTSTTSSGGRRTFSTSA